MDNAEQSRCKKRWRLHPLDDSVKRCCRQIERLSKPTFFPPAARKTFLFHFTQRERSRAKVAVMNNRIASIFRSGKSFRAKKCFEEQKLFFKNLKARNWIAHQSLGLERAYWIVYVDEASRWAGRTCSVACYHVEQIAFCTTSHGAKTFKQGNWKARDDKVFPAFAMMKQRNQQSSDWIS